MDPLLTGTVFGNADFDPPANAYDGDISTRYVSLSANAAVGIDLGAGILAACTLFRLFPRVGFPERAVGNKVQGSLDNSTWTDLIASTAQAVAGWNDYPISDPTQYRYFRYFSVNNDSPSGLDLMEIEFRGGSGATAKPWIYAANALRQMKGSA